MANKFRKKLADKRSKKAYDRVVKKNHLSTYLKLMS
jgi:hypothetical protein